MKEGMKRILFRALIAACAMPLLGVAEPTGCPVFDVEPPQGTGGPVVKAADFGFSATNADNAAAITRALEYCRRVKAARLELAPGRYTCYSARTGIIMAGLTDFTFEGKGARLVFRRPSDFRGQTQAENIPDEANLLVTNCLRTVVQNLEMDWDWGADPLVDIGTVVNTHVAEAPNASYFDLKLDCPRHPWYGRLMPIQTMTPVNGARDQLLATQPNRLLFGLSEGHYGTRMGWLAPDRIRVWPGVKEKDVNHAPHYEGLYGEAVNRRTVSQMQKGVVYRVFHYYYGKNGLYLHSNRDFTARNIRIVSCRGMGVVADGTQRRWQLINVSIDPDRDAKGRPLRPVSCTSDGIHNARSCGLALLIGCRVYDNAGDTVNFHGNDVFKPEAKTFSVGQLADELSAPVLDDAEYMSYATAYRRLAASDIAADEAWRAEAGTPAFAERARDLRARAVASFGGFPERTPLKAEIVGKLQRCGYRVEKLVAQSRPGFYVTGLVFVPDDEAFKPPYPAVLVPCGHTEEGKGGQAYLHGATLLAKAGFVSLVFDPVDQGERRQFPWRKTCGMGHNAMGALAMLLGQSGLRVRLWDAMRMLDYLETRPDVDAKRLGVMGNSGGGTMAAMLAAFDDRIAAAAPASYISSLRRVVDACGPQDSEQLVFGQLDWGLNHLGLLLLRAPTPTLVNASHDDFFPFDGTLETMYALETVASRIGAGDRYALVEASGKHGWKPGMLSASCDWMRRWLQGAADAPAPDSAILRLRDVALPRRRMGLESFIPEPTSLVTATGNVRDLPGSRSVYRVLADDLAAIERSRRPLDPQARTAAMMKAARIRPPAEILMKAVEVSTAVTNGLTVTRLGFVAPDGFTMPGVLIVPPGATGRPQLFAGDRGRASFAAEVETALVAGCPVLTVDLEGYGEIGATKRRLHVGSCADDGLGKMHYLMGDSLVGRRAEQLMAAAAELVRRYGCAPSVLADGKAVISAAHAHAANARLVSSVRVSNAPISWSAAVRRAVDEPIQWTYTDSVQGALLTYDWPDLLN